MDYETNLHPTKCSRKPMAEVSGTFARDPLYAVTRAMLGSPASSL